MSRISHEEVFKDGVVRTSSMKVRDERGDTLIEVLVSLVVLGITALAILIAFSTSISASQEHRDLATANIVLASYSQQAIAQIEQSPTNLFGCAYQNQTPAESETTFVLDSVGNQLTIPPNYGNFTATISSVMYWNSTSQQWQPGCIEGSNPPLLVTVSVTDGGQTYTNQFVVNLPSGNLGSGNDLSNGVISQLAFTQPPGGAAGSSGVPFSPQPIVTALDSNNEIVGSSFPYINLAIASGPSSSATITGYSATDSNGVVTFSGATINTTVPGTYVINASWNSITSDPLGAAVEGNLYNPVGSPFWQSSPTWYSTTFTVVVAATPDKVVFTTAASGGASGGPLAVEPIIQIQKNGAKDANQSGPLTLNLSGGSLTGCTATNGGTVTTTNGGETITVPIMSGTVTLANCDFSGAIYYNYVANPVGVTPTYYTLTASFTNAVSASQLINADQPGAVSKLVFVTQPSGVSNSTSSATPWPQPFAVEIEDAFGNPVWEYSNGALLNAAQITVAFDNAKDATADTLSNCTESTVQYSATATFSGCQGLGYNATTKKGTNVYAGGLKILATFSYTDPTTNKSATITQDSAPFSISSGPASLTFITQPVAGQSGSAFTTQPAVEILDSSGNIDTGYSLPVTVAPSGGQISGCPVQAANTGTAIPNNGVATFQACRFAGTPGTGYYLIASIPGVPTVNSALFSPSQAGVATQVQFTTQPVAGAVAGSVMTTQPVVKIEDSQGNVVTSSTDSITLSASSNGTVANCANLTAVLGVVDVSNCTFGGTIGKQYTLTAISSGLTSGISAPFASNTAAGPEDGAQVSASPTTVPASNMTNVQLNFQIVDNWNNPTVSTAGTVLTVSATSTDASSTGAFFSAAPGGAGPLAQSTTVSIAANVGTATAYFGDETVGSPTIQAYDPVASQSFESAALTIMPDAPNQLVYSLPPPQPTVQAGTKFPVSVVAEDPFGNVASTDSTTSVSLTASNGSNNGGFSCASTTVTMSGGVATFANCSFTSANPNPYTITAAATGLTSATVSTTVTAGLPTKIVPWSGNNQSTRVSTQFSQQLSALVTDSSGNPVSGVTVTFTSPNTGATGKFLATAGGACVGTPQTAKNACTAVTNASGIATSSTLTASATVGPYNVTAGITGANVNFPETNTNSVLTFLTGVQTFSTTNTSAGTTSGSVIIQAQDPNGNPVILTAPLTVNLTYTHTGTLTLPPNPPSVTIPAGSSSTSFIVAVTSATTAGSLTISAAATGYTTVTQLETVRINATANATLAVGAQSVTSSTQNANFSVGFTYTTGTALYYSVIAVNGLLPGETATPATSCQQVANGKPISISDPVNVSANRPGGSYQLDFVVESYSTRSFGGTCSNPDNIFQVDGTLNMNLPAATITVNGGNGQSVPNGTSGTALSVLASDSTGSPISGAVVTFTAPMIGASGTFLALTNGGTCVAAGVANAVSVTSCTATTNTAGIASTATFTANTVTGSYLVQATTGALTAVTFEEENQ